MHELHAGMYASLIDWPSCDDCPERMCHEQWWIDGRGAYRVNRGGDMPDAMVQWPKCPRLYEETRAVGADYTTLAQSVAWHMELGHHRSEWLGWGGARLFREYFRCKDVPKQLAEIKANEEAKEKAQRR